VNWQVILDSIYLLSRGVACKLRVRAHRVQTKKNKPIPTKFPVRLWSEVPDSGMATRSLIVLITILLATTIACNDPSRNLAPPPRENLILPDSPIQYSNSSRLRPGSV